MKLVRALGSRMRPYAFALLVSGTIGFVAIRKIFERAGHPALPLDDSFIHLQYARRLAEGEFFSYVAGEGYTTGATSLLWPILLAPFHLLGLHELSLAWGAWFWGTLAHAALAVEVMRLSRRLAGPEVATAALAMSLGFGGFAWFAWSGMETIPFTWLLVRTARASAELCEPDPDKPPVSPMEVALLGVVTPLLRPEGLLASGIAFLALAFRALSVRGWRSRLMPLVPLTGPLVVPALHVLFAGHATSATTMVKWLPANPAYDRAGARAFIESNVRLLFTSVLDGGDWTWLFVQEGHLYVVLLGLGALIVCAWRERISIHALFVFILVVATVLPCTYLSFLWNRVRYVWPFFATHFVLAACLARLLGDAVQRFGKTNLPVGTVIAGVFAGALVVKLPRALADLAESAHAIDRQQVALGFWAREHLPADARIGVNDTGAIAYLSNRKTFDVCGLTTEGEAFYWTHGAGSRFEHYEKLPVERRPSHFIVYPQWMSCEPVLGDELHRATVTDQSILGGHTMIAYEARWDRMGSGALPRIALPPEAKVIDEMDVSDLESEKAHGYALFGGSDHDNVAMLGAPPGANVQEVESPFEVADGGRLRRRADSFVASFAHPNKPAKLVMRVSAEQDTELVVRVRDAEVGTTMIPGGEWVERVVNVPSVGDHDATVEVTTKSGTSTFNSFHYWIVQ
ncbi:MAG: hypothetical protein IPM54_05310 [Polyangiaceae bacterium]|nr:hypothetical protein [Polyangiaceae bacterium]